MASVGLIGLGTVGGSLMRWLSKNTWHTLYKYDPHLGHEEEAHSQPVIFVSVPVPTVDNKQDISILEEVISTCGEDSSIIFVRSSVLPGTCDILSKKHGKYVCALPEFLTERTCDEDMDRNPLIVGFPADSPNLKNVVISVLSDLFDYKKQITIRDNKTVEMAKFTHNVFGATKVTFFNAISELCQKNMINYGEMTDLIFHTGYINAEHTKVPGPDGRFGFGGKCFPVNLEALLGYAEGSKAEHLFGSVHELNKQFRGLRSDDMQAWRDGTA